MANIHQAIHYLFQDKYKGRWHKNIIKDILRLKLDEPLDYIIGWKPFLNTKIDLSYKPLIPRPETEYWTEQFIKRAKEIKWPPLHIADVFAGSGCIGIAILKNVKHSKVDFFEIDPKLIFQIKKNLKINNIPSNRYKVIQSDILKKAKGKYDFVIGNPPYLSPKNIYKIQRSVLLYEPKKALFGGKDGLAIITRFIKETTRYLKPDGEFWFEFDPLQKKEIEKMLKKNNYKEYEFSKDQYGRFRYLRAKIKVLI